MRAVLIAALVALILALLGTPAAIRVLERRGYGQLIRDDGPTSHHTKRGTPTMGGIVIIVATIIGYAVAHVATRGGFTASGLLVLFLMAGLGLVGFLDDFIKVRKQRSLGLTAKTKFVGQFVVAVAFALMSVQFADKHTGFTPASRVISFVRDVHALQLAPVLFLLWAWVMITAASNAVNLTDGLDGLASGTSAMVFGAYVVISFWQYRNTCGGLNAVENCYSVRDPLDLAVVAAAAMGACFGFLWWNAGPAKIFMGDTGSLALGGAVAGLAITTRTELLLVVLGGLFVVETLSVVIQIAVFKTFHRRVFNMAPIHHHFELAGWAENTVIVRLWIIGGLAVAFGLGLFYAEFIGGGGL
ncbi:MAG: phospho-N-acetylmuramoyl-pentapeptide-transferase [Frankiaceae bacterium]|nr:phospho-N-acetylmuramoyl-pentapeptide-transferase [Frankiaceae bacterium]